MMIYRKCLTQLLCELMDFIEQLKKGDTERKEYYNDYNVMAKDSLVGSAIELIAEDATQVDKERNRVFWVVPEDGADKQMVEDLNAYLSAIKVDELAWTYAYNVIKDGGMYLKTHFSEFSDKKVSEELKKKLGYYFEIVDSYNSVSDLQQYGDTVAYGVKDKEDNYTLYNTKDYIHFINDRGTRRESVTIEMLKKTLLRKRNRSLRFAMALHILRL